MGENPAALRAAVFLLSSKNLRGGGRSNAPPPAGRGLISNIYSISVMPYILGVLEVSSGPKLIILRSLRLIT